MRSLVTACQLGGKNNCWLLMYLLKVSLSFTIKGFEEQHCRTVQSTIFTSKRGILASYRGTNQQWVMKEKNGDIRQTAKKKGLWLTMRYRTATPSRFSAKSTKHFIFADFHRSLRVWDAMGLSENRVNLPNEIAIFHRDNDQQNHWVDWGTNNFQANPYDFTAAPSVAAATAPTGSDEGVTVHSAIGDAGLREKSLVLEGQPSKSTREPLDTGNPIMSLWST